MAHIVSSAHDEVYRTLSPLNEEQEDHRARCFASPSACSDASTAASTPAPGDGSVQISSPAPPMSPASQGAFSFADFTATPSSSRALFAPVAALPTTQSPLHTQLQTSPTPVTPTRRPPPGFGFTPASALPFPSLQTSPGPLCTPVHQQPSGGLFAFASASWTPTFVPLSIAASPIAVRAVEDVPPPAAAVPASAVQAPFNFATRFRVQRTLQDTLFGRMLLCEDLQASRVVDGSSSSLTPAHPQRVVVKESSWARMAHRHREAGALLGEDVRKEARIMRWIGVECPADSPVPAMTITNEHIDRATCGLSVSFWARRANEHGQLSQATLNHLAEGARFIAPLHGDFDAEEGQQMHYLSTGFAAQGDLFDLVQRSPGGRLSEDQARPIFRQLLQAVQWIHARSVAHLDISVENVCIDAQGNVRLIDFGLAALHGEVNSLPLCSQRAEEVDEKKRLVLASHPPPARSSIEHADPSAPRSPCFCGACCSSAAQLGQRAEKQVERAQTNHPTLAATVVDSMPNVCAAADDHGSIIGNDHMDIDSGCTSTQPSPQAALLSRCRMLFRPVCERSMRPGKEFTTAPELADLLQEAGPWDGFLADSFALGVLLFILLTGKPPFAVPHEKKCRWFRWMITGKWMDRETSWGAPRWKSVCTHYTNLSPAAWELIDACIKPQHLRPTVDEMLNHTWMDATHKDCVPVQRVIISAELFVSSITAYQQ